jgi:hypothetical protein
VHEPLADISFVQIVLLRHVADRGEFGERAAAFFAHEAPLIDVAGFVVGQVHVLHFRQRESSRLPLLSLTSFMEPMASQVVGGDAVLDLQVVQHVAEFFELLRAALDAARELCLLRHVLLHGVGVHRDAARWMWAADVRTAVIREEARFASECVAQACEDSVAFLQTTKRKTATCINVLDSASACMRVCFWNCI